MSALKRTILRSDAAAIVVLAGAIVLYLLTSPMAGDFWWSDTGSHSMNGALILDFIASGDFGSPVKFVSQYYFRFPALTIAIYPPIFPMVEALIYALVGYSHAAAQMVVLGFTVVATTYFYRLCRTAMSPIMAAGAALLLLSLPVIALWSRQVMLEMPALALLIAASFYLIRFLDSNRISHLVVAVVLLVASVYTKQTTLFAALAFAAVLLADRGWRALRDRRIWLVAAFGILLLIPFGAFTVIVAWQNLDTIRGVGQEAGSHVSWYALTWYASALPEIARIAPLLAAAAYLVVAVLRGWSTVAERRLAVLMIAWFVTDYLFISPLAHREARYGFFLAAPIAVLAALLVVRLLPARIAPAAALALSATSLALTLAVNPIPRVAGYPAIADYLLAHTSQDDAVVFHGLRSPNFVAALRAAKPTPQLFVLRAEKLLVDVRIMREWGINDRSVSEADIAAMFERYGIEYVVFQRDFWTDQPSIARFQDFVLSDRFERIATFPITANIPGQEAQMLLLRYRTPSHPPTRSFELKIPAVGVTVKGGT